MSTPRVASRIALTLLLPALAVACDSSTEPEPQLHVPDLTLEAVGDAGQLAIRLDGEVVAARWESLTPTIVTVTESGVATAVAAGAATVRARVGSRTADGTVTVLPAVNVQLSELALVTDPSGAEGMRMRLRNLGGRGYYRLEFWKFNPDGSHERLLYFGSDAEAPVGLDIRYDNYLLSEPADWVLALSRQPLSLEAVPTSCVRLDGHSECPGEAPQQPVVVDSVSVSPGAMVFTVGQTVQYEARAFADGVEVTDRAVEWSTPTANIISLSSTGLAQALSPGYGQVEARVDGVSAAVGLTVMTPEPEPEPVAHVIIDTQGYPIRMWAGQIWALQVRILNSQWQPIEGHTVTWAVTDPSVATIDSQGRLQALSTGTTSVSATAGGKTAWVGMKSYLRPVDHAELAFFGMLSDTSALMVQPSVDTTWVDAQNVEHPAFLGFYGGHLGLDWSGASPSYEQRLTIRTFIYTGLLQMVEEREYVDRGSLEVLYDYTTGQTSYRMTSSLHPGLTYLGRYSLPGELVVFQPVGSVPPMKYYFKLQ
jgi:hypothetical protein